jgi:putative endonuclease
MKLLRSKINNQNIGQKGEVFAKKFLQKQGYKIIASNYRNKLGEIDIIAEEKDTIVFIEVKSRLSHDFGPAKGAVNRHK